MDQDDVQERYAYSRCMTCGCCWKRPQYEGNNYIGPQAIAQVRLFNMHPSGKMNRKSGSKRSWARRHHQLRQCTKLREGLPDEYPLTRAIYEENRETVIHGLFGWLKG